MIETIKDTVLQYPIILPIYFGGLIAMIFPLVMLMTDLKIKHLKKRHKILSDQISEIETNKKILKGEDFLFAYLEEKVPYWLIERMIELACFVNLIFWPFPFTVILFKKIF